MKGNEKVVIRASVCTWSVGSDVKDDYETEYTHDEWNSFTEEEQEEILNEYSLDHAGNFSERYAWVKGEDDEEL